MAALCYASSGVNLRHKLYFQMGKYQQDQLCPSIFITGAKARLAEGAVEEDESVGFSSLRKQTAVIADDPKYKGKKASRKDLYSDGIGSHSISTEKSC